MYFALGACVFLSTPCAPYHNVVIEGVAYTTAEFAVEYVNFPVGASPKVLNKATAVLYCSLVYVKSPSSIPISSIISSVSYVSMMLRETSFIFAKITSFGRLHPLGQGVFSATVQSAKPLLSGLQSLS